MYFVRAAMLLTMICVGIMVAPDLIRSEQRHKIDGEVLDKGNSAITGVLVTIYRGTDKVDEVRSDKDGKYSVSFVGGSPISTIRYEHTDWNPSTITNVSGARDHRINKVLEKVGTALSYVEGVHLLSTLRLIHRIEAANNVPLATIRDRYRRVIMQMQVPRELAAGQAEVELLYGLREPRTG